MTLVGNVLKPQAESVLIPLELTASPKVTDATIQKKMFKFCTATWKNEWSHKTSSVSSRIWFIDKRC